MRRTFIGLDPGGTTGFAALIYHTSRQPTFWFAQYSTPTATAPDIGEIARQILTTKAEVVIEDFALFAMANRGATRLTGLLPVATTAALQQACHPAGKPDQWAFQMPGLAKSAMPDQRLAAMYPQMELYTRGMPHARDAARHLLTYLKLRHPPLYQAAKGATPSPAKYLLKPHKRPRAGRT